MRPRRRRIAWWLKWLGTLGCALIAAAFAVSGWWCLCYQRYGWVSLEGGGSWFVFVGPQLAIDRGGLVIDYWGRENLVLSQPPEFALRMTPQNPQPRFENSLTVVVSCWDRLGRCILPLWLPFAALLIPTLLCWRLDRRAPVGRCRRCRYDLTSNASGRCPECGEEMRVAIEKGGLRS